MTEDKHIPIGTRVRVKSPTPFDRWEGVGVIIDDHASFVREDKVNSFGIVASCVADITICRDQSSPVAEMIRGLHSSGKDILAALVGMADDEISD
jgi:hypothetical protein